MSNALAVTMITVLSARLAFTPRGLAVQVSFSSLVLATIEWRITPLAIKIPLADESQMIVSSFQSVDMVAIAVTMQTHAIFVLRAAHPVIMIAVLRVRPVSSSQGITLGA